ncbi:MAG TPA: hypothetical protein PK400_00920 [Phycisphaerales bacterium]|nr:hypothetical protein [Phycisphaerales bacterium]HRQ74615.1 hypothetical protein [Phycisphaerales bacterium]
MSMAHICTGCGLDLARQRPAREPHYGLRLVTCSCCGTASVRRRHPIDRAWRTTLRVANVIKALGSRLLLLLIFTLLTIWTARGTANRLERISIEQFWERHQVMVVLSFIVLPMMTGMWLSAAFAHWRYKAQWLAWAGWIIGVGWIFPFLISLIRWGPSGVGLSQGVGAPIGEMALVAFGLMWLISLTAIPLGTILIRAGQLSQRKQWRRRRQRLRRRKVGR